MPYCPECGYPIETQKFCPNCGTKQTPLTAIQSSASHVPTRCDSALSIESDDTHNTAISERAAGPKLSIFSRAANSVKHIAYGIRTRRKKSSDFYPDNSESHSTDTQGRNLVSSDRIKQAVAATPDSTSDYDVDDINANKAYSVLSYCSLLVFIPLLNGKGSPYVRFHAVQGLNVLIGTALTLMGRSIAVELIEMLNWPDIITGLLSVAVSLPFIVLLAGMAALSVLGISHALRGQAKLLPIIGKYNLLDTPSVPTKM